MLSLIFVEILLVLILVFTISYILCIKFSILTGFIFGFIFSISSIYLILIKPLIGLYKSVNGIDFDLGVIDFTKLDKFECKRIDELGKIVRKFKDLSDVLVVRIDRVNDETYKSEHDSLSGLYNRTKYQRMKSVYSGYQDLCLIYIDVNNLKKMNDIKGHDAGDALIRKAADKLSFWQDKGDCYRMGGDEFMVVIPDTPKKECDLLIKRWYKTVGCLNDYESDGFKCMMAIGVVYGTLYCDTDELIKQADEKMYNHKVKIKLANGEDPNSR